MRHALSLAVILSLCVCLPGAEPKPDDTPPATLTWATPVGKLPVIACSIERDKISRWHQRETALSSILLHQAHEPTTGDDTQPIPIRVLYPVLVNPGPDATGPLQFYARLPQGTTLGKQVAVAIKLDTRTIPWSTRSKPTTMDQAGWLIEPHRDDAAAKLTTSWAQAYRDHLTQRRRLHEDHELEYLLHWRHFGTTPDDVYQSWKRDSTLRMLFTLTGLGDIQDAVPPTRSARLTAHSYELTPPKPILLPQVEAPDIKPLTNEPLASYAPRSCYYLSWPDVEHCLLSLRTATQQLDRWSGRLYDQPAEACLDQQLLRVGLDEEYCRRHLSGTTTAIAVIGWDPYFQAGTNFAVLIATSAPLTLPKAAPFSAQPAPGITILATCKRLLDKALAADERDRSLTKEPHFVAARRRLSQREGETEQGFCYLSDHWLTNFVSPRWRILRARILQSEARIRLVHLLLRIAAIETNADAVTLTELPDCKLLPSEDLAWLCEGLEQTDDTIRHRIYGGLYDHPPIDELAFDTVSKAERDDYESFRRLYVSRWQQMDPIAFQLAKGAAATWVTRLYVSPISRRSDFRMLTQLVLPTKVKHNIPEIPGIACGASLVIRTQLLKSFLMGVKLPIQISAQLLCQDFAPSSFAPRTWLWSKPAQEMLSYMRLPAVITAPELLVTQLLSLTGQQGQPLQPDAEGFLNFMPTDHEPGMPILAWPHADTGLLAIGLNKGTLRHVREGMTGTRSGAVPCDLQLWADLRNGYMLKRKFLQLLIRNRSLAAWRRHSRMYRIDEALGLDPKQRKLPEHLFATGAPHAALAGRMTPVRTHSPTNGSWSNGTVVKRFAKLPHFIRDIGRVDLFINVEPNALYFESHITLDDPLPLGRHANEVEDGGPTTPERPTNTTLDFED